MRYYHVSTQHFTPGTVLAPRRMKWVVECQEHEVWQGQKGLFLSDLYSHLAFWSPTILWHYRGTKGGKVWCYEVQPLSKPIYVPIENDQYICTGGVQILREIGWGLAHTKPYCSTWEWVSDIEPLHRLALRLSVDEAKKEFRLWSEGKIGVLLGSIYKQLSLWGEEEIFRD